MNIPDPIPARLARTALVLGCLAVAACDEAPDYPQDWPAPATSVLSRRGDCPDLAGSYDQVHAELEWLLGRDPDVEQSLPAWDEHLVRIEQGEKGQWLRLEMRLNERGLPAFREHLIRYNLEGGGSVRTLELREGRDYQCRGGWLLGRHWPQERPVHGWQRKRLAFGRDGEGALIAGATITKATSYGWGDSRRITLGSEDDTRWYRWPARTAQSDARLQAEYGVDIHRYWWRNAAGRLLPVRITSFHPEPICLRVRLSTETQYVAPRSSGPEACLSNETRLTFAGVLYAGLGLHERKFGIYQVEWRPLASPPDGPRKLIEIPDPAALPHVPQK